MNVRESRREAALARVADHLLAHGLALSNVRALAKAAGTSDRMLFYYFADKDDIIVAALQLVSARLAAILAEIVPPAPCRLNDAVFADLAAAFRGPALRPYMRLWLEVVIYAARGEEPYLTVAGRIADAFQAWLAAMIDLPDEAARYAEAARLIAKIDGAVVLDLAGRPRMADLALTSVG